MKFGNTATKLDLGCGPNKKAGFHGVDSRAFPGVDTVHDLGDPTIAWPFDDDSIEEIHMSHVMEHFTATQRFHVINEMYRIMKVGAKASVITPHWASNRAYGDLTHQWPPVSEMWFYYLDRAWRKANAPHTDAEWMPGGYQCDFQCTWGYSMHGEISVKAQPAQMYALTFYKEAAQDIVATLTKR